LKFSTGSYSTAGKRGHWPASKEYLLPIFEYSGYIVQCSLYNVVANCVGGWL